jgi:hypothetical protein
MTDDNPADTQRAGAATLVDTIAHAPTVAFEKVQDQIDLESLKVFGGEALQRALPPVLASFGYVEPQAAVDEMTAEVVNDQANLRGGAAAASVAVAEATFYHQEKSPQEC